MRLNISHKLIGKSIGIVKKQLKKCEELNKVIVGVSGGQDSVALLGILHILSTVLNFEIIVCHINHGLRSESEQEAIFVRTLCEKLNVTCYIYEFNLQKSMSNLGDHARKLRKEYFENLKLETNSEIICLGHTKTDQCETVLMHLTRGSGIAGAGGMQILSPPYLRPFLEITRGETREICNILDLKYVSDPTNEDADYFRIALRKIIIPALEKINPNVQDAFLRFSLQAQNTSDLITSLAKAEEQKRVKQTRQINTESGCFLLLNKLWDIKNFKLVSEIIRFETLKLICQQAVKNTSEIKYDIIAKIDHHVCNCNIKEFPFKNGIVLKIDKEFISFHKTC